MSQGINTSDGTYPPPPQRADRRRPTNGDIITRLEAVEKKLDRFLFAFGVDDVNDPEAWRTLGREHSIIRVQRSFCEQVGWKFIWVVVTLAALIGISQLDKLKILAGIK